MKLLLLFSNLENTVGGIPHYNRLLTRALRDSAALRGGTLDALALHDALARKDQAGWRYEGFGGRKRNFVRAAVAAGRRADAVIFGHAHFAPLAWAMPDARKCLVAHGVEVWEPLSRWRTAGIRRMHEIWSVSRFTRERFAAWSGVEPERFRILPNTLSPERDTAAPLRASLNLPSGPVLLTVSRLDARERYKNIDRLLDALTSLPDVFLVVVGEGSDRPRLEERAEKNGVARRVRFTGAIPDPELSGYYDACDVFALPSTGEGFGIVFLEAMSRGKPCVGVRAGGIPDVIDDGVTGRLVDPARPEELVAALQQLFSAPEERRRLGAAGRARFENEFAYPHFCRRVEALLTSQESGSSLPPSERLCA